MASTKVAIVHTDFRLYWVARLMALSRHLVAQGDQLHVVEIAGSGSPYDFAGRLPDTHDMPWSVLFPDGNLKDLPAGRMARAVERKLDEIRPDVVMAGGIAFPSGAAAIRWCRRNRRGIVIFDDVRLEDVPRSGLTNHIKRRVYRNVDALLIPAYSHCHSYAYWGVPQSKIHFGVDVVDNDWFWRTSMKAREDGGILRAKLGLPKRFFLGVGRFITKKNWPMLVSAYGAYRRQCPTQPWGLVLVGDGPVRPAVEAAIKSEPVEGAMCVGSVMGEALCDYYGLAGCLLLPSQYWETWGLVVNEAMACGLPVLVSDGCGCSEALVRPGENGWTFSPEESGTLAELMLRMAGQTQPVRQAMGDRSREIISEWSLDRFVLGACEAIDSCRNVHRGFYSLVDKAAILLWNGRYRPV